MRAGRWVLIRRADGDMVDGCDGLLRDVMPEEHLPYVVLFASALELPDGRRRRRRILELAAAYRALFPPELRRPGGSSSAGMGP